MNSRLLIRIIIVVMLWTTSEAVSWAESWSELFSRIQQKYASFDNAVKDMTIIQQNRVNTSQGALTTQIKVYRKGPKFRTENVTSFGGVTPVEPVQSTVIGDGQEVWMISAYGKQRLSRKQAAKNNSSKDWWQVLGQEGLIAGQEQSGDRMCYVVDLPTSENSWISRVWIDQNDLVIMKAEGSDPQQGKTTLVFSDFRPFDGRWPISFKTEIYAGGTLVSTLTTDSLQANTGLPDSLFDIQQQSGKSDRMQQMIQEAMSQQKAENAPQERQADAEPASL